MADKGWVISLVEFFVSSKIWLASLLLGNGLDIVVFMAEWSSPFQRIFLFVRYHCGKYTYLILMITFTVIFYLIFSGMGWILSKFQTQNDDFKYMLRCFNKLSLRERELVKQLLENGNNPIQIKYVFSDYNFILNDYSRTYFNVSSPERIELNGWLKVRVTLVENQNYRRLKRYYKRTGKINNLGN